MMSLKSYMSSVAPALGLVAFLGSVPPQTSPQPSYKQPQETPTLQQQKISLTRQYNDWMDAYKKSHPDIIGQFDKAKKFVDPMKLEVTVYTNVEAESSAHVITPKIWYWGGLYKGRLDFEIIHYQSHGGLETYVAGILNPRSPSLISENVDEVDDVFFDNDLDGKIDEYEKRSESRAGDISSTNFLIPKHKIKSKSTEGIRLQKLFDDNFPIFFETLTSKIK